MEIFLKELHLVEGRNTGIPTAIKAIKENGSPLPKLLTDEDRTFFSVIIPKHEAFIKNVVDMDIVEPEMESKPKRRSREQIKDCILSVLSNVSLSANELYKRLGYTGNASKSFRTCISELISDDKIHYASESMQASNNVLVKN